MTAADKLIKLLIKLNKKADKRLEEMAKHEKEIKSAQKKINSTHRQISLAPKQVSGIKQKVSTANRQVNLADKAWLKYTKEIKALREESIKRDIQQEALLQKILSISKQPGYRKKK